MRTFPRVAVATVVATFLLIIMGAVVRVSGSGLGCPDWPLCHGQVIPPLERTALIEYTHRLLGAIVSPMILAVSALALLTQRRSRAVVVPALLVPFVLAIQIALGAIVVRLELPAMVVLVHLGFAEVILGLLAWVAVWSRPAPTVAAGDEDSGRVAVPRDVAWLIYATTGLVLVLILSGAYVRATGASWACAGFPTCNGQALPFGSGFLIDVQLTHRLLAYAVAWLIGLSLFQILKRCRRVPALGRAAQAATGFVVLQLAIGAYTVSTGVPPLAQVLHVAGATALWTSMVVLAALVARARQHQPRSVARPAGEARPAQSGRAIAGAYFQLTKPRVMVLLLITTLASMMVAAGGMPALNTVFFTLLGGALASGGAGAINHYLDRDVDRLMVRTSDRPIPAGEISPGRALAFGIGLGALSFVLLTIFVNLLAAALSLGALLFYVFVYTRWLKRTSPNNIVIGGAAGAVPPLVGWAAVTGEVGLLALYLFAIVFFWTPPHFWALALLMRQEYERARIPMLPVVRGEDEARTQILLYSLQMVTITLTVFIFQLLGLFYLVAALALGGLFVYYAVRLRREASAQAARRLFRYSIIYLALLFVAMVVDRQVAL